MWIVEFVSILQLQSSFHFIFIWTKSTNIYEHLILRKPAGILLLPVSKTEEVNVPQEHCCAKERSCGIGQACSSQLTGRIPSTLFKDGTITPNVAARTHSLKRLKQFLINSKLIYGAKRRNVR